MGVGGQRQAPAALPPEKTRYPLYRRLGGHQGRSESVRKIPSLTGSRCPGRPASSDPLYQLSYPGTPIHKFFSLILSMFHKKYSSRLDLFAFEMCVPFAENSSLAFL
jgi:hypothetical protein